MVRKYLELEKAGAPFEELEQLTLGSLRKAVQDGNLEEGSFLCGAIAGMVKEIKPCRTIIEEINSQAEKLLGR